MPTLPPHSPPHHHAVHSGVQNLPTEDIRTPHALDVPLGGGFSIEAQTGTEFPEKPYPRRRFGWHGVGELRGALVLVLRIFF